MLRRYLPFPNESPFLPPASLPQAEPCARLHQKLKAALDLILGQAGQLSLHTPHRTKTHRCFV